MDRELDSIYEGLVEYHINDMIMFEGFLKRDFLEVTGVLTEKGNDNFLKKLLMKILYKINTIIHRIRNKVLKLVERMKKKQGKELNEALLPTKEYKSKQYIDQLNKNRDLINNTDFSNFKLKNFYLPYTRMKLLLDRVKDIQHNQIIAISYNSMANGSLNQQAYDNIKKFLKTADKFYKNLHNEIWGSPYTGGFKGLSSENIINYFDSMDALYKNIIVACENQISQYTKIKDQVEKMLKEVEETSVKESIAFYKKVYDYVVMCERDDELNLNFVIREFDLLYNNTVKLATAALAYAKQHSGKNESAIDMDYIEAVSESELYQLSIIY